MARRRFARAPRKTKEWFTWYNYTSDPADHEVTILPPGSYFTDWILNPLQMAEVFDSPTHMRSLFELIIAYGPGAGTGGTGIYPAAGLFTCQETGAGPQPLNPLYDGWMSNWLWTGYPDLVRPPAASIALAVQSTWKGIDVLDIRSRRKLPPGTGLAFIVTNPSTSDDSISFSICGRSLFAHA